MEPSVCQPGGKSIFKACLNRMLCWLAPVAEAGGFRSAVEIEIAGVQRAVTGDLYARDWAQSLLRLFASVLPAASVHEVWTDMIIIVSSNSSRGSI